MKTMSLDYPTACCKFDSWGSCDKCLLRFAKRIRQTVFQRKLRYQSFTIGCKKTRPHGLFHVIDSITSEKRTMLLSD